MSQILHTGRSELGVPPRPANNSVGVGLKDLSRYSHLRRFSAGEVLVREREPVNTVGFVVSGVLRLIRTSENGREQTVGLLFESDIFGGVFADTCRYAIETATEVTLRCFDRHKFETLLSEDAGFKHQVFMATLSELEAVRSWTALITLPSAKERIAAFIVAMYDRGIDLKPDPFRRDARMVYIPIGRRYLASFLATTPETVSRCVQQMVREGLIRSRTAQLIEIMNMPGLRSQAGLSA